MINKIFIVSNSLQDLNLGGEERYVFACLPVNPGNIAEAYLAFGNSKNKLTVFLKLEKTITKEAINDILSFLFVPSYQQIDGTFIINVAGQSEDLAKESVEMLSLAARQQGFNNLLINFVSPNNHFISYEDFLRHYVSLLENPSFFGNNLFLECSDLRQVELIIAALKEAELSFEKKHPLLFSLASENLAFSERNNLLSQKVENIQSELRNQKEYADLLRSSHSTRKLQDYYTKEYEILPTWYKRVGHIVKVITGKRSFRSLFNDKIKKHKD